MTPHDHFDNDDPRIARAAHSRGTTIEHIKKMLLDETPLKAQLMLAEFPYPRLIEKLDALANECEEGGVLMKLIYTLMRDLPDSVLHSSKEEQDAYRARGS